MIPIPSKRNVPLRSSLKNVPRRRTGTSNNLKKNPDLLILNGRYGPYISFKKKNYRIPKSRKPEELTLEECREIIEKAGSRTKK